MTLWEGRFMKVKTTLLQGSFVRSVSYHDTKHHNSDRMEKEERPTAVLNIRPEVTII
jgi:hypothetical protein